MQFTQRLARRRLLGRTLKPAENNDVLSENLTVKKGQFPTASEKTVGLLKKRYYKHCVHVSCSLNPHFATTFMCDEILLFLPLNTRPVPERGINPRTNPIFSPLLHTIRLIQVRSKRCT